MEIDITAAGLGELGAIILIAVMTIVTLIARFGGLFLMAQISINYRIKQFIAAMSASVLIAIVAPVLITGDHGARLALLATAVVQITVKKPLVAIFVGIMVAALSRNFVF